MPYIYIVRSAFSRISLVSFLITFLSPPEIATICYQTRSFVVIIIIIIIIIITIIITVFIIIIIADVISVSPLANVAAEPISKSFRPTI